MYCNDCGKKLSGNEKYCPECGKKQEREVIETTTPPVKDSNRTASIVLGIVSLVGVLLVIFSPLSLILSIIGLIIAIKANKEVDNVAGIILNSVGLFLSFILTAIILFLLFIVVRVSKYGIYDMDNISEFMEETIEKYYPNEESNYGDNF